MGYRLQKPNIHHPPVVTHWPFCSTTIVHIHQCPCCAARTERQCGRLAESLRSTSNKNDHSLKRTYLCSHRLSYTVNQHSDCLQSCGDVSLPFHPHPNLQ